MSDPTGGAVLVARAMQDSAVWGMPEHYLKLWLYLLMNVRWDERPYRLGPVTIGYGQVLKSYRVIADECQHTHNRQIKRWSTSQVKAVLDWLEGEGMIKTHGTELGTLITVRNFKRYQAFSTYAGPNPERDSEQPKNNPEQPVNNRKQEETGKENNLSPFLEESEKRGVYSEPFEELWDAYPRNPNDSKAAGWSKYKARIRADVSHAEMMAGVERYARYVEKAGTDAHFIKHLKTFLGPEEDWRLPWEPPRSNGTNGKPHIHGGPYVPGAYGNA